MEKKQIENKISENVKQQQVKLQQTIADNKEKGIACCPKCGSTSIATINKGFGLLRGFIGSGKPVNVCQVCGHKWEPKG